jgi:Tol biopolymer transport system component
MRALVAAGLVLAMCLFGFGVYHAASFFKNAKTQIRRPTDAAAPALNGTMYVVQAGAIYRFQHGTFRQIIAEDGWMQPALSPDGSRLVAVKRSVNISDLYVMSPAGRISEQLTHSESPTVESNHWVFYPRFSADGSNVFFSYDAKDPYNSYRVDLAILATSAVDPSARAERWTIPNDYTGGDVNPVPLRSGGLIYTKFSIDAQSVVHSQVWLQERRGSPGVGLTKPADDCGQPTLSKDETLIAMVCRRGGMQAADLDVAAFDASTAAIGEPKTVVHDAVLASPTFSPDGKLVAFLAPSEEGGPFQLWTVDPNAAPKHPPRQITTNLDLDAISPPAWTGA